MSIVTDNPTASYRVWSCFVNNYWKQQCSSYALVKVLKQSKAGGLNGILTPQISQRRVPLGLPDVEGSPDTSLPTCLTEQ